VQPAFYVFSRLQLSQQRSKLCQVYHWTCYRGYPSHLVFLSIAKRLYWFCFLEVRRFQDFAFIDSLDWHPETCEHMRYTSFAIQSSRHGRPYGKICVPSSWWLIISGRCHVTSSVVSKIIRAQRTVANMCLEDVLSSNTVQYVCFLLGR
jgi:hypothetical protein